jgi:hypothetical protein
VAVRIYQDFPLNRAFGSTGSTRIIFFWKPELFDGGSSIGKNGSELCSIDMAFDNIDPAEMQHACCIFKIVFAKSATVYMKR